MTDTAGPNFFFGSFSAFILDYPTPSSSRRSPKSLLGCSDRRRSRRPPRLRHRRRLHPFQGLRRSDRRPRTTPIISTPSESPTGDRLHPFTSPPSPVAAVAESPAAGTISDFLSSLEEQLQLEKTIVQS